MSERPVVWLGRSRETLRGFPVEVRHQLGQQLLRVQRGLEPRDWKPMPSIGPGVRELRVHRPGEFRVIYLAGLADTVYVLHALEKKSRKTPPLALELARLRYRSLVAEFARKGD